MENETTPTPVPAVAVFDPRRRMRELLAIPDRDRTDAEWDELNELEIQTAPGNRAGVQPSNSYLGKPGGFPSKNRSKSKGPHKPGGGSGGGGGGRQPQQAKSGGGNPHKPRQVPPSSTPSS